MGGGWGMGDEGWGGGWGMGDAGWVGVWWPIRPVKEGLAKLVLVRFIWEKDWLSVYFIFRTSYASSWTYR